MVDPEKKPWWKMIIEFSWSTGPRHLAMFLQDFQRPVRAQVVSPRKHQRGPLSSAPLLGGDLPTSQPRWPSNLQLGSHHFLPGNMMKCIRFGYTSFRQIHWKEHEILNHQIWRYRGVAWHSRSKWTPGKEREFLCLQPVKNNIIWWGYI